MKLKIKNSVSEFELTRNFRMTISSYNKRTGVQKRYGKDGGVITGDQRVDSRDITLKYEPVYQDDSGYLTFLNFLSGFFARELFPYYLIDTDNNRRAEIVLNNTNDNPMYEGGEWRIGNNNLKFEMLDAHWEDLNETIVSDLLSNNDSISVNNDSYIECFPVIKLRPSDTNTDFQIKNTTNGKGFIIGSSAFSPGSELTVNSQNGTIYLNDGISQIETSSALADGSGFISLSPGSNNIVYKSAFGPVEIDIIYRRRYAF